MMIIKFNRQIEPENIDEINKYLKPFLWLVPGWCYELNINLYHADGNAAIRTSISYEYRFATMDFYSPWLLGSSYDKGWHVVHDLLHISNSIYVDFAEDCINRLCSKDDAPKYNAHLMEESRIRCESMTQDQAKAIFDRFRSEHL